MVLVPEGAGGVALKLELPYVAAYADKDRFRLDDLSMLIAMFVWGISLSHYFAGNFVSQMHNPVIK